MTEELTVEEQELLNQIAGSGDVYPKEEDKQNLFKFFKEIIEAENTTRTANLKNDELGIANFSVRANLETAHYCKSMGCEGLGTYFDGKSSIISDSSLSRDGFLIKQASTTTKQIESRTKSGQIKKRGLFSKRTEEEV